MFEKIKKFFALPEGNDNTPWNPHPDMREKTFYKKYAGHIVDDNTNTPICGSTEPTVGLCKDCLIIWTR